MKWQNSELKEIVKYFKTGTGELTLFQRIHKINPYRTYEAVTRQIRRMKEEGYEKPKELALKSLRVGYLDIEATKLDASFGFILSWFIKEEGKNHFDSSVVTRRELFNYEFDKRVVEELLEAMKNYDVLYTHYGSDRRFDIPFIRTRAFVHGMEDKLPRYMEQFIMDTYPIARNKLKLYSNRLGAIASTLKIKNIKTSLDPNIWVLASVGHPESLNYIVDHNKKDVILLENVYKRLRKIDKPIFRSI